MFNTPVNNKIIYIYIYIIFVHGMVYVIDISVQKLSFNYIHAVLTVIVICL